MRAASHVGFAPGAVIPAAHLKWLKCLRGAASKCNLDLLISPRQWLGAGFDFWILVDEPRRREPLNKLSDGDLRFHSGHDDAKARMNARSEGDRAAVAALNIEPIRISVAR